LERACVVGNYN